MGACSVGPSSQSAPDVGPVREDAGPFLQFQPIVTASQTLLKTRSFKERKSYKNTVNVVPY